MEEIIRTFQKGDIGPVKEFTDQEIGTNYYGTDELREAQSQSIKNNINCSFVLMVNQKIQGLRLTYPPGHWRQGRGHGLTPKHWPFLIEQTGYFQSLFVSKEYQKKGWGKKLSRQSLAALKNLGARGVVCHSWIQSPGNASLAYTKSLGFKKVADHPNYWKEIDYQCTRCGKPCVCTAREMYLIIDDIGEKK